MVRFEEEMYRAREQIRKELRRAPKEWLNTKRYIAIRDTNGNYIGRIDLPDE